MTKFLPRERISFDFLDLKNLMENKWMSNQFLDWYPIIFVSILNQNQSITEQNSDFVKSSQTFIRFPHPFLPSFWPILSDLADSPEGWANLVVFTVKDCSSAGHVTYTFFYKGIKV